MKMNTRSSSFALVIAAAVVLLAPALLAAPAEDWADSPEAYFLTSPERAEWFSLRSQPERDAFKARYWLRRDPTPGTPKNEFQELVRGRIRVADERFKFAELDGSRTARGFAFVVFGTPARVTETPVARPGSYPATRSAVPPQSRMGPNDGLETVVVWKYERDRTPKILQMLSRPTLEFTFYLEPERKRDRFEIESLPRDLAAIVAERSIVNPDLVGSAAAPVAPRLIPVASLVDALSPDAVAALESGTRNDRVRFGFASLLNDRQIAAWFFVPEDIQVASPRIAARVTDLDDREVERVLADVGPTSELFASERGRNYGVRIPMPAAGFHHLELVLLDGAKAVAAGSIPRISVPPATGTELQISSLVVSGGVDPVTAADAAFSWGDVQIMPRSDGAFSFTESLWYFLQVANPSAPESLLLDVRLRRGNVPYGEPVRIAAQAGPLGEGLYLVGRELPLMSLEPGTYALYVTVIDGKTEKVARADFRVVGPQ